MKWRHRHHHHQQQQQQQQQQLASRVYYAGSDVKVVTDVTLVFAKNSVMLTSVCICVNKRKCVNFAPFVTVNMKRMNV